MKVYLSLQKCRVELQKRNLKKSGHNKFAGYTYFELSDVLPTINELMLENGLCSFVNFDNELATLTIMHCEDGSNVTFTCPVSEANLKGCHPVQNLGAVQTYTRRYLYTNAFEIVESDALDSTHGRDDIKPKQSNNSLSEAQVKRLYAIGNKAKITPADILKVCINDFGVKKVEELNKSQYDTICKRIESKVN